MNPPASFLYAVPEEKILFIPWNIYNFSLR